MTPYYEDSSVVIYHGDCRDVATSIPPVDLVLTDPPYGIGYVTARRSHHDKLRSAIQNDANLDVVAAAWPAILATLKADRHWYAFASPRNLIDAQRAVGAFKQVLCWDKGDRGTIGDLEAGFGEAWEAILYGMKGRRPLNGSRPRSLIRMDWSSTMDPVHPTVKPVPLLGLLIRWSSMPGETVFDPFMGSGTTLRAAKDLGRKAIGIEVREDYCEVAAQRLSQETLAL